MLNNARPSWVGSVALVLRTAIQIVPSTDLPKSTAVAAVAKSTGAASGAVGSPGTV